MNLVSIRLITDDVQRLAGFYEQVTGVAAAWSTPDFAEIGTPTGTVAIGHTRTVALFGVGNARPADNRTAIIEFLVADVDAEYARIQCTADLLPADVTGTSVYSPATGEWDFRPGPIFTNVVLVDEVNRASPRTQAALLEPMEERQVTVDGITHPLPDPFFLVATQNPFGSAGTFPLPESQLDRFALVCSLGLPGRAAEREILDGTGVETADGISCSGEPRPAPPARVSAFSREHRTGQNLCAGVLGANRSIRTFRPFNRRHVRNQWHWASLWVFLIE